MSASLPSRSPRLWLPSEDAVTLICGLLVVALGFALSLRAVFGGEALDAAGVNMLRVIVLVLALFSLGVVVGLRRLLAHGLGRLAAAFLLSAASLVIWLGLIAGHFILV